MAIRRIYTADKPVLHQKAKPAQRVDGTMRKLLDDMVDTMRDAPGLGLAAPQIGILLRAIVVEHEEQLYIMVNPEISWASAERELGVEGCLSIPGYEGDVDRHSRIRVKGKNEKGKNVTVEADGMLARIFQHEVDHLDGILFPERMAPGARLRPSRPVDEDGYPIATAALVSTATD